MIYWRRYGADYLVSTIGFTMEMDGAYGRLLDQYYEREGPLPVAEVIEIARATKPSDVEAVERVLALKFVLGADGCYHHARADAEIALAKQARENGGKHVGKSGKVTRTRTGKPTGKITDTATGEITRDVSQQVTETAQESNRTTVQPSTRPSAQRKPRGKASRTRTTEAPPGGEPADDITARNLATVRDVEFPEDLADAPPQGPHRGPNGSDEIPWWHSAAGITAQGAELGLSPADHPEEGFTEFKARVIAASGPGPWEVEQPPAVRERVEFHRSAPG